MPRGASFLSASLLLETTRRQADREERDEMPLEMEASQEDGVEADGRSRREEGLDRRCDERECSALLLMPALELGFG